MRLYAYDDIPPNAQITVSYLSHIDLIHTSNNRRKILLDGFGFRCQCDSCQSAPSRTLYSDLRLKEYRKIRNEFISKDIQVYARDKDKVLKALNRGLEILKTEKKFDQLGEVYEKIHEVHAIHGEYELSKIAASNAMDHYRIILGNRKANRSWLADQMMDPTKYPLWGKLKKRNKKSRTVKKVVKRKSNSTTDGCTCKCWCLSCEVQEDDGDDEIYDMEEPVSIKRSKSREWDEQSWDGRD
ncbi:uncharacterized protein L199_004703 [Kwoniella botswanensis]|uniref:uncharacterized protein n=1 Tax=Kwoniella botswanensis TaxID=1268659 RepID=UPI00315C5A62